LPFITEGSNELASPVGENDSATACNVFVQPGMSRDVWYILQGDNRCYSVSTEGSKFDTVLAVFTSTNGCESLVCLGENDDYNDVTSQMTWATTSGTDYYIFVSGYGESTGTYNLNVEVRNARVLVYLVPLYIPYFTVFCLLNNRKWTVRGSPQTTFAPMRR